MERRHSDLEAFYEATYSRLVGVVAVAAANRADAEEVVQEAFVRLLPRWERVSRYDDPEAWVRLAAFRLLSNRARQARNAVRMAPQLLRTREVQEPAGDHVDLNRALRRLSLAQRQVLVLHHVVGLQVPEIAAELGVPVGTVKSRLSRGRDALKQHLVRGTESVRP